MYIINIVIVYYASHIASNREGPVDATAHSLVKYTRYAIARLCTGSP